MIKLLKGDKPRVLVENENQWTKDYLLALENNGDIPSSIAHRYKHESIKSALEKETHGKCAYCESKIGHIDFGDIEHILPKKKGARPDLYVNWNNLTIACSICNRSNKKDYYDPELPLVNPYCDNPEEHFLFLGSCIFKKANDVRGHITVETLDLNRSELLQRRQDRLKSIDELYSLWEVAQQPKLKDVLAAELRKECSPDKEYSAFVRHFLIAKGFPLSE